MIFFTSRGGRSNEGTIQIDGMNVGSAFNGGGVAGYGYDTTNAQEVQLTVAGGLGEADRGGPQFNIIPKTGGNMFSGTVFGSLAGKWSQGNNVDDTLKSFGIPAPTEIIKNWDTSFSHRRPDQAGQSVVLRGHANAGRVHRHRRALRQPECRRPDQVELRRRSEHQVADRRAAGKSPGRG